MLTGGRERALWGIAALIGLLVVLLPLGDGGADHIGARIVYIGLPALSLLALIAAGRLVEPVAHLFLLGTGAAVMLKELFTGTVEGQAMAWMLAGGWLLIAAVAALTRRYKVARLLLLRAGSIAVAVVSVIALLGLFGFVFPEPPSGRAEGTFFLPTALAGFLNIGIFVGAAAFFYERKVMLIPRLFHFFSFAVGSAALLASGSRGGWVAAGFGLLVITGVSAYRRYRGSPENLDDHDTDSGTTGKTVTWEIWAGAAAGFAALVILALPPAREIVVERLGHLFTALDYSLRGRMIYWSAALELIGREPLAGIGFDQFRYYYTQVQPTWRFYATDPHSGVLNIAVSAGLPLTLAWAGSLGYLVWRALCKLATPWRLALLGGLAAFTVHVNIDFDLTIPAVVVLANICFGLLLGGFGDGEDFTKDSSPRRSALDWGLVALAGALTAGAVYFGISWQESQRHYQQYQRASFRETDVTPSDWQDRRKMLNRAYRATPDRHNLLVDIVGWSLSRPSQVPVADNWPGLQELSLQAMNTAPADAQAHYRRGRFLWERAGAIEAARERFERALELAPKDYPLHYFHYIRLLRNSGRTSQALEIERRLWRNISLTEPMSKRGVRPRWNKYNRAFARTWQRLLDAAEAGRVDMSESELEDLRSAAENFGPRRGPSGQQPGTESGAPR